MADLRIVAADDIKGSGLEALRNYFGPDAVVARGKFDETELCEKIADMDALLVRSGTKVTRKAIERAMPRLRLFGRAGVGVDNIDVEAATARGIVVMNTPLGNTISAAEQAIALLFASARHVARADALMQQGKWDKKSLVGVEVYEKTLGLIGLGRVGGHVAKVMRAAGMTVLAYDPFLPPERAKQMGVELADLDEILARADFLSLHTPLTDRTKNLLSAERLAKTKKGVRIVNCARGGILDEAALAELVKSGHIAAAGLDVFATEPTTSGPLFGLKDVTLTPHLGASTEEAEERCGLQMAEQVIAYFRDGEIKNAVNTAVGSDRSLRPFVEVARLMGTLAATLLEHAPERIEIACSGRLAEKDTAGVAAAAVEGMLKLSSPESVNMVNAPVLARQRGIAVSQATGRPDETYQSLVEITLAGGGRSVVVAGTALEGKASRIVRIDEFEMDLRPSAHLVVLRYPDRPGYVGKFGTLLGNRGINIGGMEVGRTERRGEALVALALDEEPTDAVLNELRAVDGVRKAYRI